MVISSGMFFAYGDLRAGNRLLRFPCVLAVLHRHSEKTVRRSGQLGRDNFVFLFRSATFRPARARGIVESARIPMSFNCGIGRRHLQTIRPLVKRISPQTGMYDEASSVWHVLTCGPTLRTEDMRLARLRVGARYGAAHGPEVQVVAVLVVVHHRNK